MNVNYEAVAKELAEAYTTKQPITPPRETLPGLDLSGAYRIQQIQEEMLVAAGEKIAGRKIGLTSLAMQQQLGVDSPDFGFFTEKQVFRSGDVIDASQFISPKVEPELGFVLNRDLPATATMDEVREAIGETFLAVEIIDSRVRDWDIKLVDTVADNASCAAIVLGNVAEEIVFDDLPSVPATMTIDGEVAGTGEGSAVMGHPVEPLVWLAQTLGEQGVGLKAGDIVLTGSFCAAAPVIPGSTVDVDFGRYGQLSVSFS
ncbi:fumarylacetoacetate hydrolase family protein [Corynebacterium hindlerae]|uniref:Fumarylacetoacetate hydrolase family protein n=1 Tax=Corynebacterium hindlerae TaxID=699041 RepID=A0A7G5FGK8_9CORY|nr:fumarylacetoacetate hydrolase family protein [Corynebacterium hindlerae]QMV85749.1 fumarylacetoacetate hydrolase family protein [Corynebacterium hindlerae]